MKNFYEATIIKPKLTLACCLSLQITHDTVPCVIKANGLTQFEGILSGKALLDFQLSLTDPIEINIQLIDRQHPNAVEIELIIDGNKILPKYQHLAHPQTCYIDTNDIWQFKIDNFYPWLHTQTGQGWIA